MRWALCTARPMPPVSPCAPWLWSGISTPTGLARAATTRRGARRSTTSMASSITPTGSTTSSSPPPWEGENYEPRNPMESAIFHLKRRTLLRPTLPAIIQARGRNVGMPQPLLHFGNVRIMRQGIRRRGGTQRVHAEAMHISIDAHHSTVVLHYPLVHRIRMQMLGENLGDVILHRPEESPVKILLVLGLIEILSDE